jgi:hypothetical protein
MKGSSPVIRESILLALRQELEAARKRAEIASAHFDEALKSIPSYAVRCISDLSPAIAAWAAASRAIGTR